MGGLDVGVSLNQSAVNASAKLLPDLEFRHPLWWDLHRRAGLGIAARARLTMADAKAPEAADLNFFAAHERLGHRLQDRGDNVLALALREAEGLRQLIDQVSARHDDATPQPIVSLMMQNLVTLR